MSTETKKLQKILSLIANDNKLKIVLHLAKGEACVCDMGEKLGIEQSLVSHHLNSLKEARLVKDRKIGAWVHYSLNKQEMENFFQLISKHLGPNNISGKMCSVHEACKCLTEGVAYAT
ncbi:MAG: metalloregulator ArsR/SmtB family transcription factor [Patescibacteria group bacterium]|nr:metalloregulator ArsR/SmtB family transcription factor [Patescibacteria group bacterium]MCL5432239.1 metalloregulator ArsR/SmtB family transcription factor [Patescibacteria group bacterium]